MIDYVQIGKFDYNVELVDDLKGEDGEKNYYGFISHVKQNIQVEKTMHGQTQKVALLHEILHGIVHQSGIFSDDEESMVIAISHGVYGLLRDNPDLVAYIVKDGDQ